MNTTTLRQQETPRGFYEGKWTQPNRAAGWLRNWLVKKQRFLVREVREAARHSAHELTIADLGCGGGWDFLAGQGRVVGVDLSYSSLQNASRRYSAAALGTLTRLPLADGSCDVVISQDVLGHIPAAYKEVLLAEIWRVLKPGGRTIHYIETQSDDPLSRFARRHPDLHERHILAPEGHIGAELATSTFARFRRAGFAPLREQAVYKALIYVERFVQYFDNDYRDRAPWLSAALMPLRPVAARPVLRRLADGLITLGFELLDPLLPRDWAGGALVSYRKIG